MSFSRFTAALTLPFALTLVAGCSESDDGETPMPDVLPAGADASVEADGSTGGTPASTPVAPYSGLGQTPAPLPDAGAVDEPAPFHAYEVVAQVSGSTVEEVTRQLAGYLHEVDDTTAGLPGDWILAGGETLEEGEDVLKATLNMPQGGKILDLCNKDYAMQAMSFGPSHATALPCAISVHADGTTGDVFVTLLEPASIFNLFFADVPAEHMASMGGLVEIVGGELRSVIQAAVGGEGVEYPATPMGPEFTMESVAALSAETYNIEYTVTPPVGFAGSLDELMAETTETLLTTLTYEGQEHVGSTVEGLSAPDWRAARSYALGLPTGEKLVEVCSPTYATMALSTGYHHASSLPCQVSLHKDEAAGVVVVQVLDPAFIFSAFFSDIPAEMASNMGEMAATVREDITLIVEAALAEVE